MDEISNERLEEMLAYTPTYDEDRETRVWYRDLRLALTELCTRRAAGGEAVAWVNKKYIDQVAAGGRSEMCTLWDEPYSPEHVPLYLHPSNKKQGE